MSVALKQTWFESPLGPMLAIADDAALYLLEFSESRGLTREIERLEALMQTEILDGETKPIHSIQHELELYFKKQLTVFNTPIKMLGSSFQQRVWTALTKIPYGETRSYLEQAKAIGQPSACRAVANANGKNQLAILIPCHRVINTGGALGGYGGGIDRKQWLLKHEQ